MALVPQALFGLPAAYNFVLLIAFTLSGYGAFRLARLFTGPLPAFLGGVVFAFTPYTLDALKGQLEVLSVQWMPLYAEAWLRSWQPAASGSRSTYTWPVLAGVFFALAAYSSLYYALYLVVFTVAHLVYVWVTRNRESGVGMRAVRFPVPDSRFLVPTIATLLLVPLILGLAATRADPRLEVRADPAHRLAHSADLLSFFAPPHDHPLLGNWGDRPGVNEPAIHDYLSLGYVALALSLWGVWVRRRDRDVRFWWLLGLLALLLAMGPQLQVGRHLTGIPLPFALFQALPGADAIAKPERFVVLARLCMAVLVACGVAMLGPKSKPQNPKSKIQNPKSLTALHFGLLILLLVELPIHPRYVEPLPPAAAWRALAGQPEGGLMELPFATQQAETVSERMLAQTTHAHPIMAGYLSRNYNSPIISSCSPFWGFISPLDVPREGHELASPLVVSNPLDVLNFYRIGQIALDSGSAGPGSPPLDPKERTAFEQIIAQAAEPTPIYKDADVAIYRTREVELAVAAPSFHIGGGWYPVEEIGGAPFRWLKEREGTLCVFAPHAATAALTMEGTAFAHNRGIALTTGGKALFTGTLPSGGQFAPVRTAPVDWPPGVTEVRIIAAEAGNSPRSLDPSTPDDRPLSVGLRAVRLESTPQK
jgi:hypothetical protein